ncbi:MAG: lipid-A-disaccharide synthase [Planctomycetota bacterium]
MIWATVLLTLLRELIRAAIVPFRLLGYLPFRHRWRARAREALDAAAAAPAPDVEQELQPFFALGAASSARAAQAADGDAPRHVFISAGEASGELHAARLVRDLQARAAAAANPADGHSLRVSAFGGSQLEAAGAQLRFSLSEHAVMGVIGVLKQLPLILRAVADYLRMLRDDPPALVVLVDYPGLHLVLAKLAKRRKIPVLHYVAPQYWAWGPWRMRRYRRAVDATLTILPFETEFFRRQRVPATYIGHPLLDEIADEPPAPEAVAAAQSHKTIVILPGSRRAEIAANLPGLLRAARSLQEQDPSLRIVVPHKNPRRTAPIRALLQELDAGDVEHHEGPLSAWLAGAWLVLAKSGTGSLEACLHGPPTVVVYKLRSWFASLGYHNILSVPYIAGANLIAGREIVPEHCFHGDDGWRDVQQSVHRLCFDEEARRICQDDIAECRRRLGAPGATARTAAIVHRFLFGPAASRPSQAASPAAPQP